MLQKEHSQRSKRKGNKSHLIFKEDSPLRRVWTWIYYEGKKKKLLLSLTTLQRDSALSVAKATRFKIFTVCLELSGDVRFERSTPIKLLSNVNSDVETD